MRLIHQRSQKNHGALKASNQHQSIQKILLRQKSQESIRLRRSL